MPWKRLRQQTYWPKLNNFWTTAHHHFQKPHLKQTMKHDTQNTLWYIITRNTWHIQLHGWIIYFAFWDWYQRTTNQSYLITLFTSSHHPYVLLQTAAEVKLCTQLTMPKIIKFFNKPFMNCNSCNRTHPSCNKPLLLLRIWYVKIA